jgi:hypothetical protein
MGTLELTITRAHAETLARDGILCLEAQELRDCSYGAIDIVIEVEQTPPTTPPASERHRPVSPAITLTEADVDDLADGARINVPAGPHRQEIILDGEDFDDEAIAALRAGNTTVVDGYTFVAESAA